MTRGERGARGGREGMEMGDRAKGGNRVRGNFNMLRPFRVGGGTHGIRKNTFYHGIQSFTVGRAHGIRKKKFYHGIRPFRVGGGIHGIRKRKLYHGTREGVALGVPPI